MQGRVVMAEDRFPSNTQVTSLHRILLPLWGLTLAGFLLWLLTLGVNV
jgi:hypothetical protein